MSRTNPHGTETRMDVDVSQAIGELSTSHDENPNVSLSSQAIFWPVRHPTASPFLAKLPFLFWIMEASRPRKVVQLGIGDGLIYMALCQAAERLGGQTLCMGIDSSDSPLPTDFQVSHDTQYRDISVLFSEFPAEGASLVRDADVLVLNSPLEDERSRIILESWLPQLSKNAVVLVCKPTQVFKSQDLRRALLDESEHLVMSGMMSPGGELLDVILYGDDQPERLRRLASSDYTSALHMAARQVFGRLGQGIENAFHISAAKAEITNLEQQIETLQVHLKQREFNLSTARSPIELLQPPLEANRVQTEAAVSTELVRSSQWQEERSKLTARLAELETSRDDVEAVRSESQRELEALRKQKAEIEAEHAARIEDISVLMREHENQLSDLQKSHQQELENVRNQQAKTQAEVEALREEKNVMQVQHDEIVKGLYDSTSWRITKPLRTLKLTFTR
ncbi:hypothetical protein [Limimaricola cinnabarinus]|uniref:hypothetical protein n=1 Tax=Limimaricola cinnabarinus TaxID=1125964 RepID=UPI002FE0A198